MWQVQKRVGFLLAEKAEESTKKAGENAVAGHAEMVERACSVPRSGFVGMGMRGRDLAIRKREEEAVTAGKTGVLWHVKRAGRRVFSRIAIRSVFHNTVHVGQSVSLITAAEEVWLRDSACSGLFSAGRTL